MGWVRGQSGNPAGRRRGSKNKFSRFKEDCHWVHEKLGGRRALLEWARSTPENKRDFYRMFSQLQPKESSKQLDVMVQGETTHRIEIGQAPIQRIAEWCSTAAQQAVQEQRVIEGEARQLPFAAIDEHVSADDIDAAAEPSTR